MRCVQDPIRIRGTKAPSQTFATERDEAAGNDLPVPLKLHAELWLGNRNGFAVTAWASGYDLEKACRGAQTLAAKHPRRMAAICS